MPSRRASEKFTAPTLTPEQANTALTKQLEELRAMKGTQYFDMEAAEQEWLQFTRSIIERAFGSPSSNLTSFSNAKSAGEYYLTAYGAGIDHSHNQRNFEARINALEAFMKASLRELEMLMPKPQIAGTYAPGEEYEFYKDLRTMIGGAKARVMIVDPYLNRELFDIYIADVDRSVKIQILTANPSGDFLTVAHKYGSGGNLELGTSNEIHDRAIFVDDKVWIVGQSFKDAAKKKSTYIVEHDGKLMDAAYQAVWSRAVRVI